MLPAIRQAGLLTLSRRGDSEEGHFAEPGWHDGATSSFDAQYFRPGLAEPLPLGNPPAPIRSARIDLLIDGFFNRRSLLELQLKISVIPYRDTISLVPGIESENPLFGDLFTTADRKPFHLLPKTGSLPPSQNHVLILLL